MSGAGGRGRGWGGARRGRDGRGGGCGRAGRVSGRWTASDTTQRSQLSPSTARCLCSQSDACVILVEEHGEDRTLPFVFFPCVNSPANLLSFSQKIPNISPIYCTFPLFRFLGYSSCIMIILKIPVFLFLVSSFPISRTRYISSNL